MLVLLVNNHNTWVPVVKLEIRLSCCDNVSLSMENGFFSTRQPTCRAHQVTAASVFALMHSAYSDCKKRMKDKEGLMSEEEWKEAMAGKCPQFLYWASVLQLTTMFELRVTTMDVCNGSWELRKVDVRTLPRYVYSFFLSRCAQLFPGRLLHCVQHDKSVLDHCARPCRRASKCSS